jgi:tocopherol cyclase
MKRQCLVLAVIWLCGCSAAPYNALIWNRENAAQHSGAVDTGPWYEWWYYKVVIPEVGQTFYFIYGVVNPWDTQSTNPSSRAYVGMGNFAENAVITQAYPVSDFTASYSTTDVRIQDQRATASHITGSLIAGDGGQVAWDIRIAKQWGFNAMGWAMFVPEISNIFWYPAQAHALFTGRIHYKDKVYTFVNAPGYQDRNWGRTFPEWWAWIVADHFEGHPDAALAAGGGKPVLFQVADCIEGLSVGLFYKGREYAFRPNDGDLERILINFGTWEIEAANREGYRIVVEAAAPCDSFMDIPFETPQGEQFHDFESLTGTLTVRLYEWVRLGVPGWRLIETLHSDYAGIEYGHRDITLLDCHENDVKVLYSNF